MPLTANITAAERGKRLNEVRQALASVRLEGLDPGEAAKAIFQRYVDGVSTAEEMGRAIDQLLDREYGPVRLPGNECS